LLCDTMSGKTLPYAFVEAASFSASQTIISAKDGHPATLAGVEKPRPLFVRLSTQDEMLRAIFPHYKLGFAKGLPVMVPGLDRIPSIVDPEDIRRLDLCNISKLKSLALQPYERPFLVLATIVEKVSLIRWSVLMVKLP
jgi:hypothetical protein